MDSNSTKEKVQTNDAVADGADLKSCYMQKFRLYETRSKFYMIGRDKHRTFWRVLKIDRLEPSELNIVEDSTIYSEIECCDLLRRVHEGNKSTGGLKFVTTCYGIIGFIKFLEPYYMLLITKRRKIGTICGHNIYAITKSEMVPIPHSTVRSKMAYSKDENRYKKLLCSVDLAKDFFFSYSYNVMFSLQRNLSDHNTTGQSVYETLFVWNEFLTRGIRNNLQNTSWTVALVHGFFKQVKLSISDSEFNLTIIARRSRHYAGTRYLKRGVNEKGRVANDVETEQIVFTEARDGHPMQISSVVQNRGSIPLFWSQEASRLNIKPDIILSRKDSTFEATRLHFDNLVKRYGKPIIILNLIKTREKRPRETILRAEFANAVRYINKSLRGEDRLRFLHWDLHRHSRCKATNVLGQLAKVAAYALKLTGIFYSPVTPNIRLDGLSQYSYSENNNVIIDHSITEEASINKNDVDTETEVSNCYYRDDENKDYNDKPLMLQSGVLRTNCIDCLDRTNVAQYAYGLAALGRQLQVLGFTESPNIDLDNPLAEELMEVYESMGDTLAFQYGGSAAHNKIFSERRGQWKAATQSQEFIRTLQRYYNNTYLDGDKQKAINLFLGHFQPQQGKPALWELDSDQYYAVKRHGLYLTDGSVRSTITRSLSDGNILGESDASIRNLNDDTDCQKSSENPDKRFLSGSTPDIFTCGSDICHCRQIHGGMVKGKHCESGHICYDEHGDACDCSNFLDVDWLSSSGNSCEEELLERSTSISSENIANELVTTETSASESGSSLKGRQSGEELKEVNKEDRKYSERFERWVNEGDMHFV
ncbi:phosphoinositide phosphatase SAC2-like isoform X2 [Vigna unguiculata]|uniref:Mannosyl-oligosaccharide alpha-1 n=1 Tax=Vigna unguiculata TaxID=3917 RepID=A0A4D6MLJ6_VIGUN|nr:phosphoinositide phosphatase SAC2-like isoform X2 [Vigna unguiculata]QCE02346.1 mannosyl-oligosaccharide alpha-1 [Vigna unguiculata]